MKIVAVTPKPEPPPLPTEYTITVSGEELDVLRMLGNFSVRVHEAVQYGFSSESKTNFPSDGNARKVGEVLAHIWSVTSAFATEIGRRNS